MASDLCKKHSFGYEPLKVIGLSVAGKDCILCLAEENDQLQATFENLKKQYYIDIADANEFYFPKSICQNLPPELFNGHNACLSCPMLKTCRLFKQGLK